jgi:glycosyltransferase involved in cell wall biosynthesis
MRIAYVVPYVPNLIRTRPYNLICQLAALGHEVTVFTLGHGAQDRQDAESLRSRIACVYYQEQPVWNSLWNSLKIVPSRRPLQTVYSWNWKLAKELVKLLRVQGAFDVVHVEHLRGSLYGQYIKSQLPNMPVVWDSVDCISYLFQQASVHSKSGFGKFITRFELGRTRQMEGKLIGEFDHVLVTSKTDKNALLELSLPDTTPAPISVLPNGVDLEFFYPNPGVQRDPNTLVFSGKMSYHANISMVKSLVTEIMPRIWEKRPTVRLIVVGKDPPVDIRRLNDGARIHVTGTVGDIRPFLWKSNAAIVPLVYGAGIQNKILEAMATGTPVITNSKVLASLSITPGKELLVADTADEFASCALKLIDNQILGSVVGEAGFQYVTRNHNWVESAGRLGEIYSHVIFRTIGRNGQAF